MSCDCESPDGTRLWTTSDGVHLDVRGLECPEPLVQTLGLIERGDVGNVIVVHLDQEPLFLYPELDERGWSHEVISSSCGDPSCEDEVRLRLVRMRA